MLYLYIKWIARIIVAITFALDVYVYHYNIFRGSKCSWPDPNGDIKMLAFGDPQISGTGPGTSFRKRLDVAGNDLYLGHIYEVMTRTQRPSHLAVMGDLFSSQWIGDDEFVRRVQRYKERIFVEPQVEIHNISGNHDIGYGGDLTPERLQRFEQYFGEVNYVREYRGGQNEGQNQGHEHGQKKAIEDTDTWLKRVAGGVQKVLGQVPLSSAIEGQGGDWRIVVLNSMALDNVQLSPEFQQDTLDFLRSLQPYKGATVLLLHVPLFKEEGHCSDGPYFSFYDWGGLREQNQLTQETSQLVLNSVFGPGNPYGGIILTGHDHRGCDTIYEYDPEQKHNEWTNKLVLSKNKNDYPQHYVREIVVRSMMGEYGGYTGLLSGGYNTTDQKWVFDYNQCPFGVQHIWWVSKVLTYISAVLIFVI